MSIEPGEMNRAEFLETFGQIFEHSPWIAENTWDNGNDFENGTAAIMHEKMCTEIQSADQERQLALLRAHPELACAVGSEGMTDSSQKEQRRSGLDQCSTEEFDEFQRLNAAYREKFGFPFILAIKGYQRHQILENFRQRVQNPATEEFDTALAQVMNIGLFRLQEILQ